MTVLRGKRKFIVLYTSLLFTSKRLITVLRCIITFDLHISGNEKQKFFVETYQTNFELCLPHANKSSSFHGICSSYWLGLDLQCTRRKSLTRTAFFKPRVESTFLFFSFQPVERKITFSDCFRAWFWRYPWSVILLQ